MYGPVIAKHLTEQRERFEKMEEMFIKPNTILRIQAIGLTPFLFRPKSWTDDDLVGELMEHGTMPPVTDVHVNAANIIYWWDVTHEYDSRLVPIKGSVSSN